MNGILNVLKPPDMTSFDVVGYLRGLTKIKKIGHTGTLDPAAVGVLPVCIGNATKAIEYLTDKDKLYRAELTLGIDTDTQDATGATIKSRPVNVSEEQIRVVLDSFQGQYHQTPPMYSAIKIDGKRLYDLARNGITIERKPRLVEIYSVKFLHRKNSDDPRILFDVACSKGTYIRTLCADIGEKLGCGGHMSFLVRMSAGSFKLSEAVTLKEINDLAKLNRLEEKLIQVKDVFKDMKKVVLNNKESKMLMNGLSLSLKEENLIQGEMIRIFDENEEFISLGEVLEDQGRPLLKSKKLFV